MPRILLPLLLALSLLRPAGTLLLSMGRVGMARMEALHRLPRQGSRTRMFVFSKQDLRKQEVEEGEFWHDGVLYDQVSSEALGADSVRVSARPDWKETEGLIRLATVFGLSESNRQLPGAGTGAFVQMLFQPFLVDPTPVFAPEPQETFFPICNWMPPGRLCGIRPAVFSPPPERTAA